MGEESGRGSGHGSGRVRLFVSNRGSSRVKVSPGRVGSKKSDPWTTLGSSTLNEAHRLNLGWA